MMRTRAHGMRTRAHDAGWRNGQMSESAHMPHHRILAPNAKSSIPLVCPDGRSNQALAGVVDVLLY